MDKDSITLSHGPIASMQWGPMTMDFKLPKDGMPSGIREGSTVKFEFKPAARGEFEITAIQPTAPQADMKGGAKK